MIQTPTSKQLARGRWLLLTAALLWSTGGLFAKSETVARIPLEHRGPVLACYRALFAAACLLPFVRRSGVRWRPMLVPMVVSFASMNVLYLSAVTRTTVAASIFLQYTSVGWAFLFAYLFLGERFSRGNVAALVCAACGIVWITAGDWNSGNSAGNMLALGSGVCYAGVILSLRALRGESATWLMAVNLSVSGFVLLPWVLWQDVRLDTGQWGLVALFGPLQIALPYVLFAWAVRWISAQEAALITLVEPLAQPIWVSLAYAEQVAWPTLIGGGLILGGLVLRYTMWRPVTDSAPRSEPAPR